jgi:hypothetical protein
LLSSAHKSLLKAKDLLEFLPRMIKEDVRMLDVESNLEKNLVELGSSWRAPLCEMTLCFQKSSGEDSEEVVPSLCFKVSAIRHPLHCLIVQSVSKKMMTQKENFRIDVIFYQDDVVS